MVRVKRRYILAQITPNSNKSIVYRDFDIVDEITNQVAHSYGDFGVGCLKRGFSLRRHDTFEGYIVIQVRKGVHDMVMSVMPLITKIGDKPCQLHLIHLSGTMRSSFKHLQKSYIMNLRATIAKKMEQDAKKKEKVTQLMDFEVD